eukprot:3433621-Pyramimonas_sp.AAC.2
MAAAKEERAAAHASLASELTRLQARLQSTEQREIALTIVLAVVLLQALVGGGKRDGRTWWWMGSLRLLLRLGKGLVCVGLIVCVVLVNPTMHQLLRSLQSQLAVT